jgi:hypothetical protein
MARPVKQGIEYYPINISFLRDIKIRKIMKACGASSISVLLSLLSNIYGDEGYYVAWDSELSFLIADEVGISEGAVTEVVNKAVQVNFFDKSLFDTYKILSSKGIQERYLQAVERRKQVEIIREFLLISDKNLINVNINLVNACNNSVNVCKSTQSKVKESKEKKKERYSPAEPPDEPALPEKIDYGFFMEQFNALPSFPKIRAMTDKRKKGLKALLKQYSPEDILAGFQKAEASDFLSGRSGKWAGCGFDWIVNFNNFVKLLEGNYDNKSSASSGAKGNSQRINRFANFPQRKRDYEKLEKMEAELLMKQTQGGKSD